MRSLNLISYLCNLLVEMNYRFLTSVNHFCKDDLGGLILGSIIIDGIKTT